MSTVGHIMDLPSKKLGVTINDKGIKIDYVVIGDKDKVIADICKAASGCDAIFLALTLIVRVKLLHGTLSNKLRK